jgi:hypothetical protein
VTFALIGALVLVNAGWLVVLDRRDTRDRAERQMLLQRIQAPQAAVHEHHHAAVPPAPAAGSGLPMSDEEVADLQNRLVPDGGSELARIIAQMEAVENGSAQIEDGVLP